MRGSRKSKGSAATWSGRARREQQDRRPDQPPDPIHGYCDLSRNRGSGWSSPARTISIGIGQETKRARLIVMDRSNDRSELLEIAAYHDGIDVICYQPRISSPAP